MKPIIEIKNIGKRFRISTDRELYLSLRDTISALFTGAKGNYQDFWALQDVSFDIQPGDSVGVIGKNGSGKSTLLKILSKITPPTTGSVISRGRIASLLEVGTGFHTELSGRENVYMNGSILGMRRNEIDKNFDAIVEFSGVEKFIDTPLKHFSSGMQLRLAFAVAAFLQNEILLLDEVLAVGDAEFQKKCLGKMDDVRKDGRTFMFVSHNIGAISQHCQKCVYLKDGRLVDFGPTDRVVDAYLASTHKEDSGYTGPEKSEKKIWIRKIRLKDEPGNIKQSFLHNEPIQIHFEFGRNCNNPEYTLVLLILDRYKNRVFASESPVLAGDQSTARIAPEFLVRGSYTLHAFIHKRRIQQIDLVDDVCDFSVVDVGSPLNYLGSYDYGNVFGNVEWI